MASFRGEPSTPLTHNVLAASKTYSSFRSQEMLFKVELFDEMEKELFECRTENERLMGVISDHEKALEESQLTIEQLQAEKEAAKRQLEDLQATLDSKLPAAIPQLMQVA